MLIKDIADFRQTVEAEHYLPKPERLLSGNPQQSLQNHFSNSQGNFHAGVWESEPGSWKVVYTEDEYCEILIGVSRIHDQDGNVKEVKAGDRFVIPSGFTGIWEVLSTCKKVYVMFEA